MLSFCTDGNDDCDNTVRVWDAVTGKQPQILKEHSSHVMSVAFSPNGRSILSGSKDRTAMVWDTATWKQQHILRGHSGGVNSVAFSPDSCFLASGSRDNTIRIWDATGELQQTLEGHEQPVSSVTFSPSGHSLNKSRCCKTVEPLSGQLPSRPTAT
jgi:WD40 repeat protein